MKPCQSANAERSHAWAHLVSHTEEDERAAADGGSKGRRTGLILGLCVVLCLAALGVITVSSQSTKGRASNLRDTIGLAAKRLAMEKLGDPTGTILLAAKRLALVSPTDAAKIEIRVPAGTGHLNSAVRSAMLGLMSASHVQFLLEPGTHYLSETLTLDSKASGFSFSGNGATISGGIVIDGTWDTHQDINFFPIWEAVDGSAQGNVKLWRARLPAAFNASDLGATWQLWRGQKRLTCAKSPEHQLLISEDDEGISAGWDLNKRVERDDIIFNGDDIKSEYRNMADVRLCLYKNWEAEYRGLEWVNAADHVAHLSSPSDAWWWARKGSGARYYVANAFEELDEVDEFYVDRWERVVYIGVERSADPNAVTDPFILTSGLRELVVVEGNEGELVQGVSFADLEFAHTAVEERGNVFQSGHFLSTSMVHVKYAHDVKFVSCTFRATGGYGVWADVHTSNVSIRNSHLTDLGAGGIRITGNSTVLTSESHTISNNVITDGGHWFKEGVGVFVQYAGNVIINHNEISHMRYSGVSTGWTWGYGPTVDHHIRVAFNHIHNIGLGYLTDMACIYTLGHQPGSVVTNNYCHDVQSYDYGGWGYYADEGSRDIIFENNIAHLTKCAGFNQHYGTDNIVSNNILMDVNIGDVPVPGRWQILMQSCDAAFSSAKHRRDINLCPEPSRTPDDPDCCCHPGCDQGKCSSLLFTKNIVYLSTRSASAFTSTSWPTLGLKNLTFENNIYYSEDFNEESEMFDGRPRGVAGEADVSFAGWNYMGHDNSSQIADPQLGPGYTVSDDSPALRMGFEPIDVTAVGPRVKWLGASHMQINALSSAERNLMAPLSSVVQRTGSLMPLQGLPTIAPRL